MDTASEALAVSLSEKAGVDLAYMSQLAGKSGEEITKELAGNLPEPGDRRMGNRRRVFKRECAGEAVSGKNFCGEPPGICH